MSYVLDRVKDLDAEVMALQKQLQKQEEDATNAIQQWQEGSNIVDEKCIELERELEVTMKEKKSLEATIEKLKFEQEQYAGVKSSFEAKMSSLEEALKGGEATDKELTAQLRLKDEELRQARDHIARDEDILRQREGKRVSFPN